MYSKIEITGVITVETGMHIGASDGFAVIGAIDSPVAKDLLSRKPYIPGSTLKGKIRSLVAKAYNENEILPKHEDQDDRVTRLFGTSKDKVKGGPSPSRVIFTDTILCNYEDLEAAGVADATETKEENTINPITAIANPRQIERVVRGAKFPLTIIYNVEREDELIEDMKTLALGIKLLEYDYIGGHGSRGYGRVSISDINTTCVIGDISEELIDRCKEVLEGK